MQRLIRFFMSVLAAGLVSATPAHASLMLSDWAGDPRPEDAVNELVFFVSAPPANVSDDAYLAFVGNSVAAFFTSSVSKNWAFRYAPEWTADGLVFIDAIGFATVENPFPDISMFYSGTLLSKIAETR